ncbi:hypothetical protein V6N12_023956 [Hibiscus sabdariffa]|uniref:Phorbol-ester/DAG-type domain-containing protein n=1 Tax=Hibiscus sabdariffa TaxID=183260 RepID=A0ABR2FZC7_9ROSI
MKLQHFYHHHELCFKEVGKDDDTRWCYGCWDIIHGPAYICSICCKVAMHKSCAELPPQIQKHTFHPHPLKFDIMNGLVCDACRRLTFSIISYRCMSCELKLDFKCAMAIFNDENVIAKRDEEDSQGTTIPHFSHQHQLTRCILSLVESLKVKCVACKQAIQGTFSYIYVCIPCLFVIHESCMNEMPRQVQRSPFHPHHALLPRPFFPDRERQVRCYVCSKKVQGFSFYCNECDVNLHVSCANYPTRAIKHTRHPHNLLQLGKNVIHKISCNACGKGCDDSCFSCKECDFNIHPQCIPLPSSFTHKRHMHPLVLVSSVVEDDTGDYCCDICETERNPDLQVYYCDECNFIAHIDCVLSEVLEPTIEMRFDPQRKKENSGHQGRVLHKTCGFYIHLECVPFLPSVVKHKRHMHSLVLTTVTEDDSGDYCCDTCETPRNPEHDVYHCKECNYISHIGCIISKVERPEYVLKYVTPRSNAWPYRIVKFAGDVIPLIETNMGKLSEKMESWKDKFFSWKD